MDILDVVKRECKGNATDDEVSWLSAPERVGAWYQALLDAIAEFESQMMYHKTRIERIADDAKLNIVNKDFYVEEKEKFEAWYRKALRYRSGLVGRASDVKMMLSEQSSEILSDKLNKLISAIHLHRKTMENLDMTPEKHDADLWEVLTTI